MKVIYYIAFLMSFYSVNAQDLAGLYVNDFKDIIGKKEKEEKLLNYVKEQGFNYLILYNLNYIDHNIFDIDDKDSSHLLAKFIYSAKTKYGVKEIAAVGEKNSSFDKVKVYNSFYPNSPNKRFDVFNLEFEFWNTNSVKGGGYYCETYLKPNNFTCTVEGAFDFYKGELSLMKNYGDRNNVITETYIGSTDRFQSDIISLNVDRVLVHYYRHSDVYSDGSSIYQYNSSRISDLAATKKIAIMPIFSARPNHMHDWLLTNSTEKPYDTYLNGINGYNAQSGDWKTNINFGGYVWYRYTDLIEIEEVQNSNLERNKELRMHYDYISKMLVIENAFSNYYGEIFTIQGEKIMDFIPNKTVYLGNLDKGLYLVKIQSGITFESIKIRVY